MQEHKKFLRRCIELARQSVKEGDWPFGAVLTMGGKTLAEGLNQATRDITGHAEANAIKSALESNPDLDLSECTLYSSFEPCPMCSFLIREHGIGNIVYGLASPYWGGESRWQILKDEIPAQAFANVRNSNPPKIVSGVLADEVRQLFDELSLSMYKK